MSNNPKGSRLVTTRDSLAGELQDIQQYTQSELQTFFRRTPFLAGTHLRPAVQGTMDVSLQWPLTPQIHNLSYTAAAGTNVVILAAPPPAQHVIVQYGYFHSNSIGGTGRDVILSFQYPGSNFVLTMLSMSLTNRHQCGFIGGSFTDDQTALGFSDCDVTGIRSVYVPNPLQLVLFYTGATPGESVVLRTIDYTFPATQPLSTLLQF